MPSTAETAERYHSLANKRITPKCLFPLDQWVPRKIFSDFRFHWNAIWTHRLALEVACQMDELGNYYGPNGQVIPPSATASGQPIVRDLSTNMGAVRGIHPG